jgi:hypothetical protein
LTQKDGTIAEQNIRPPRRVKGQPQFFLMLQAQIVWASGIVLEAEGWDNCQKGEE